MKLTKIRWSISIGAALIAVIHFVSPHFSLDTTYIIALVLGVIPWLAPIVKSVELPGGFKIEVRDIKEATDKVIAATEAVAQTFANERPRIALTTEADAFTTIRQLATSDPNLALVGFRIELERRLIALAQRHGIETQRRSAGLLLRELRLREAIPGSIASGLSELLALGNQAAHGAEVSPDAARWMLEVGPTILAILDETIRGNGTAEK
jgi:hypothetical protein